MKYANTELKLPRHINIFLSLIRIAPSVILFSRNYPEKINLFVTTFRVLESGVSGVAPEVIGQHTVFNKQAT